MHDYDQTGGRRVGPQQSRLLAHPPSQKRLPLAGQRIEAQNHIKVRTKVSQPCSAHSPNVLPYVLVLCRFDQ